MKEVILSIEPLPEADFLTREIDGLREQKGRTYTTFVTVCRSVGNRPEIQTDGLVTTSKEIHLRMGKLSREGQIALVSLLEIKLGVASSGILLFTNEAKVNGIFVTMSECGEGNEVTNLFHLAPAY